MLKSLIEVVLNKQIGIESAASYKYLAFASWCDVEGYSGAAKFLYEHSDEERMHMMKLFRYINDKGGKSIVPPIEKPQQDFKSLKDVFEHAYKSEVEVTEAIHQIAALCLQEADFTTYNFIQWYINEQLEEENLYRSILDKFKLVGEEGNNLYFIDVEIEKLCKGSTNPATGAATEG
ncbi:MAG: ferritin [Chitinophagales bacterium]|nr:ferritin [Chitinophagales bacterium]MCZ2393537.1 ferritin [Chitinophagales bacterium]